MKARVQTYKRVVILLLMMFIGSGISVVSAQTKGGEEKRDTTMSRAERHRVMPVPTRHKDRTDPLIPNEEFGGEEADQSDSLRVALEQEREQKASQTTDNGQQTTDDGQQTTDNGQQTTDDGQQTTEAGDSVKASRTTDDGQRTTEAGDTIVQTVPRDSVENIDVPHVLNPDEVEAWADSVERAHKERMENASRTTDNGQRTTENGNASLTTDMEQRADSLVQAINAGVRKKFDASFTPEPTRALWLALVFPGAGQIYNHKYWKLPIFYGGFLGCMYALNWNNQMLRDYTQAYLDIMDDDPNTKSYTKMLPMGYDITGREARFKEIFKNKKNYYRKYRDMSIFAFAGVYALSVIDAYVDAELSTFDISRDLSLQLLPTTMKETGKISSRHGMEGMGLQCRLNF